MNLWRPLPWQESLWLDLSALVLQSRLPHALLITGPAGVGKRVFARALSAFLLCEARAGFACGTCRSCLQLGAGNHPNALLLAQEGLLGLAMTDAGWHEQGLAHWTPEKDSKKRDIAIAAGRKMMEMLSFSSHYQGAKVVVIDPADALNLNSVNALLKTIEEPPPQTHLLLISERPGALPATLRSRCQRLRCAVPAAKSAWDWLQGELPNADPLLLEEAQGAPLQALKLARSQGLDRRREWSDLTVAVLSLKQDPLGAAQRIGKDDAAVFLQWLSAWLIRQLRRAVSGQSVPLGATALNTVLQETLDMRRRLELNNGNPQMLLESLLVLASRKAREQRRVT